MKGRLRPAAAAAGFNTSGLVAICDLRLDTPRRDARGAVGSRREEHEGLRRHEGGIRHRVCDSQHQPNDHKDDDDSSAPQHDPQRVPETENLFVHLVPFGEQCDHQPVSYGLLLRGYLAWSGSHPPRPPPLPSDLHLWLGPCSRTGTVTHEADLFGFRNGRFTCPSDRSASLPEFDRDRGVVVPNLIHRCRGVRGRSALLLGGE